VRVSEDRKSHDDSEPQPQVRNRQVMHTVRVEVGAVTVVVNKVSARETLLSLIYGCLRDVQAPVIIMVHAIAGAVEEPADIPAEIQNLTSSPNRVVQHVVEVRELGSSL